MTLIECFDKYSTNNIAASLYLRPDRLILLGERTAVEPQIPRYQSILAGRRIPCTVEHCPVPLTDVDAMVRQFSQLLKQDEEYVIDIAGGEEQTIWAVGAAMTQLPAAVQEHITLQKLDPLSGKPQILRGKKSLPGQPVQLKISELLYLSGGALYPDTAQPDPAYTARDLDGLWALVCRDPRNWNKAIAALRELESKSEDDMQVSIPLSTVRDRIDHFDHKLTLVRQLLQDLHGCGAIVDHSRENCLAYRYRSPLMRACTQKAGNVLEHKAFLEARMLQADGDAFFHDCRMSVQIDWDGHIPTTLYPTKETRNEIDLVLIRGTVPLFVSCKNGDIGEAELYKLDTVADRFGGPYAKKMLIATDLGSAKLSASDSLAQRCKDMNIMMIRNAAQLSRKGWQEIFLSAMQDPTNASENHRR